MNVGKAIYYILSNATSVTDICGTRIFPEVAEQEAARPFVVYQITSVSPDDTNDGPAVIDEVSIDCNCIAETYNQAADLASVVRAALDRVRGTYNGVNIESIQFTNLDTAVDDDPRRYAQYLTFIVRVFRDAAVIATGQSIEELTLGRLYDVTDNATTGQVIIKQADGTWAAGDQGTGAGGVDSVNGETGVVTLTTDDISDVDQTNKYTTAADITKLAGIEAGAQVNDVTSVNGEVGAVDVLFIRETVKNVSGSTMYRGTPVHVTGAIGGQAEVIAASASTNYPAHYILDEDINAGASGYAISIGLIADVSLTPFSDSASNYSEGDEVYLGASGGFTTTRPTGTNAVQLLGVVLKVNTGGNQISGYINGMGRVNSLPNVPNGQVWMGDSNAAPTATALNADHIDDTSTTNKFTTAADISKLAGIEAGAEVNPTASEIKTAYESNADTNAFTDAEQTKLAGIETGAQVNVATNLTHTASALTVRVESSTGSNTLILAATASAAGVMTANDRTKLDGIATGAEVNVNADWTAVSGDAEILNKPTLATVATSGAYADLSGTPSLATVATSGAYSDLTGTPTIPNQFFTVSSNAGTAITLNTGDEGTYIRCTASSAVTITVPADKFQVDDEIIIEQAGTGQVEITAGASVTLNNSAANTTKTAERYSVVALKCVASNTFTLTGERELV